ncbi:hypothetical protein [Streptomyces niveus]|uniref:hypothetical protein n=1 Tax=Streptomyces niveus TaxID=193462 RepID=UPI003443A8AC
MYAEIITVNVPGALAADYEAFTEDDRDGLDAAWRDLHTAWDLAGSKTNRNGSVITWRGSRELGGHFADRLVAFCADTELTGASARRAARVTLTRLAAFGITPVLAEIGERRTYSGDDSPEQRERLAADAAARTQALAQRAGEHAELEQRLAARRAAAEQLLNDTKAILTASGHSPVGAGTPGWAARTSGDAVRVDHKGGPTLDDDDNASAAYTGTLTAAGLNAVDQWGHVRVTRSLSR